MYYGVLLWGDVIKISIKVYQKRKWRRYCE
ncbi:hypothetical protein KSS87_009894 [Heliosperma pusillum]|nr:hypothetical protein KSS87_006668 [Heliosperma pusillum]KAH9620112.1 hypothetical protein KSS87_009894 [Heliosperma pusillum]